MKYSIPANGDLSLMNPLAGWRWCYTPAIKVADLTPEELTALIRESVEAVLIEHFGDPDAGLELREELRARLLASLESDAPSLAAQKKPRACAGLL